MFGIKEAEKYMREMRCAVIGHLMNPDSIYFGREGHLRLARECGVALKDFDEAGQKSILSGSYGIIYVTGCNLKPILDAKEWIIEMKNGMKRWFLNNKWNNDFKRK